MNLKEFDKLTDAELEAKIDDIVEQAYAAESLQKSNFIFNIAILLQLKLIVRKMLQ